jgi:excisionase family DNA binding protein
VSAQPKPKIVAAGEKRAFQIKEAADYIGLSRSKLYELIRAGEIEMGKIAGRSVILREHLEAFVASHYQRAG